jgi:hypothetical protein
MDLLHNLMGRYCFSKEIHKQFNFYDLVVTVCYKNDGLELESKTDI